MARDEQGMGVVLALIVILIAFVIAGSWVQFGTHQVEVSGSQKRREQAFQSAEAGLNFAINELRTEDTWAGSGPTGPTGLRRLPDGTGEYEVTVENLGIVPPSPFVRKKITTRGYTPSKTATNPLRRQIEQVVELIPLDQFSYTLFTSNATTGPTGPTGLGVVVNGDVYARGNVTIGSQNTVGNVQSRGTITARTRSVSASLHALGAVTINNGTTSAVTDRTRVLGNVKAGDTVGGGENITAAGFTNAAPYVQVGGSAQASGLILPLPSLVAPLMPNFVVGARVPSTPPQPPPDLTLPTFDNTTSWPLVKTAFGAGNWREWTATSGASGFNTYWTGVPASIFPATPGIPAERVNFLGAHRILCTASPLPATCGTILLNGTAASFLVPASVPRLAGNTLIYTDRPVSITYDIANLSTVKRTLVIISTATGNAITVGSGTSPATAGAVKFPNLDVLLFAPNGTVLIQNSSAAAATDFRGAIYANAINIVDPTVAINYGSVETVGFQWGTTSAAHFDVRSLTFREVPFVERTF